jgi:hypothetical protein
VLPGAILPTQPLVVNSGALNPFTDILEIVKFCAPVFVITRLLVVGTLNSEEKLIFVVERLIPGSETRFWPAAAQAIKLEIII